jgi:hypothetical protein
MQYASIERVCGRTTKYDEVYGPYYAPYPSLIHRPLNAITIYGKNLFPDVAKNINNWNKYADSWWEYKLDLPDGWYCITIKVKPDGESYPYYYLEKSANGEPYSSENAAWTGAGMVSYGYLSPPEDKVNNTRSAWFKVDSKNDVKYRLVCYNATQEKIDRVFEQQIEMVEMLQDPSLSYRPDKEAKPTDYEPYIEPITYNIPDEIKNLPGYGHGMNEAICNYIDFENNRYVQMCECRPYEDDDSTRSDVITVAGSVTCAPLDKPIITPIAEYFVTLDSIFKVQAGGVIGFDFDLPVDDTFANGDHTAVENAAAAPSTITYQIKVPLEGWE